MKDKKMRPVTVRIEMFKEDINKAVLNSELPAYLIEILLGQYLIGVSEIAKQEKMQEAEEWEQVKKEGENDG